MLSRGKYLPMDTWIYLVSNVTPEIPPLHCGHPTVRNGLGNSGHASKIQDSGQYGSLFGKALSINLVGGNYVNQKKTVVRDAPLRMLSSFYICLKIEKYKKANKKDFTQPIQKPKGFFMTMNAYRDL